MTGGAGPKRKGSQFERDVAAYLRENGHPNVERAYGAGRPDDVGDLDGLPGVVIECKNQNRLELAAWVDETERERLAARAEYGVAVVKRKGRSAGDAYVVMPLHQLARLLCDLDGRSTEGTAGMTDLEAQLDADHRDHQELIEGCPSCDEELEVLAAEAAERAEVGA